MRRRRSKILVTGGAGFIGSNFVLHWLGQSDEPIVNLDALTYAGNPANLESLRGDPRHAFVRGDIDNRALVGELLRKHEPRAVINFAAETHVDRSIRSADRFVETNIVGTYHLIDSICEYWAGLGQAEREAFRFVHVSTDEVYGSLDREEPPFTERHPYEPNSPYAASKAASDHMVRAWHRTYGLPVLTTNCSNNYGPYQFPEKLIPLVIVNSLAGKKLPIYGDGQQIRDWLFVEDHCRALVSVLSGGVVGETYNIGGSGGMTNLEVVERVCDLLDAARPRRDGRSYREQIEFVTDRPGHDRRYAIDAGKIASELGWAPRECLDSGLKMTVDWYLANESWVADVSSGDYRRWIADQYGG